MSRGMLRSLTAALFALAVFGEAEGAALEDLCKAAEEGNLGDARNAVAGGADVNEHGCDAQAAPIHRAVWSGKMNVITLLVGEGANVDARQADGASSLHIAVENTRRIPDSGPRVNDANVVNFLLAQNPNVNAQDNNGKTPLVKALEYNFLIAPVFDALLNNDANVNLADGRSIAPLHLAAYREMDAYYARELLKAGANPNQCGPGGRTALHFAALVGNAEKVALLLANGANIRAEDDDGQTAAKVGGRHFNFESAARRRRGGDGCVTVRGLFGGWFWRRRRRKRRRGRRRRRRRVGDGCGGGGFGFGGGLGFDGRRGGEVFRFRL